MTVGFSPDLFYNRIPPPPPFFYAAEQNKKGMGVEGKPQRKEGRNWKRTPRKMRARCVSTTTSDESAVGGGVEELVDAVRTYVEGKTTEVRVEGGRGVEEAVAGLKEAKVVASAGRRETRGVRKGVDVVVRVVTEGKGDVRFVGRVEVVPKVIPAAEYDGGEVEIAGRVWKRRNLRATKYKDGTEVERALTAELFLELTQAKKAAYYKVDEESGNLYNGYVDVSADGLSPSDEWEVASGTELAALYDYYYALTTHGEGDRDGKTVELMTAAGPVGFQAELWGEMSEGNWVHYGHGAVGSWWVRGTASGVGELGWWVDFQSGVFSIMKKIGDAAAGYEWRHGVVRLYGGFAMRLIKKRGVVGDE